MGCIVYFMDKCNLGKPFSLLVLLNMVLIFIDPVTKSVCSLKKIIFSFNTDYMQILPDTKFF